MRWAIAIVLCGYCIVGGAAGFAQSPSLSAAVASGELEPVVERLPEQPRVLEVGVENIDKSEGIATGIGRYGGQLRLLMGRGKDIRIMTVYGYARLLVYNRDYKLVPDILESLKIEQGRVFTLRLRRGHRWSSGDAFTSEDFRYFFEDIASNDELSPFGPPRILRVEGELPRFEVLDSQTVRYTWSKPNPFFLPALASPTPLYIYAPSVHLKQFHAKYSDRKVLDSIAKEKGQKDWAARHNRLNRQYRNTNKDLPSLQPWVVATSPPSTRFEFKRNPYFHRVDQQGQQLPYIDEVVMSIADGRLIPAKAGAGETDLQARGLSFSDFTFLKSAEDRARMDVQLWETTKGAHLALFPNMNVVDPAWRELMLDVRFRRALSLAINRYEINQVIYYGLARSGNNTVHPRSPLYEEDYRTRWATFDLARANALLDEIGLLERDARGIRLMKDGRPLEIIVETAGEDSEQADVLELIADSWRDAGIKLFTKPLQREVFRKRVFAGLTQVSVWGGLENGLATAQMSPAELAPVQQQQLQWPMWGHYHETSGRAGEPIGLEPASRLIELNEQWLSAKSTDERASAWRSMLEIHADQVFSIGVVSAVPQPVVHARNLMNVPAAGIYNWDPGAHFGIYSMDTWWFREER